jgi:iron complex outermembrane recepter protein
VKKAWLFRVSVAALSVAMAQGARAQDAQVEDIKVSGSGKNAAGLTRQEEKVLQKTPRSADIVTGQKAAVEHFERLSDFSQLVPNYRPNLSNPQTSRPSIRGVGVGAGTGNGTESDTGFLIDNVFWKSTGFQWSDFVELENIEVGLGPQGTAGGKNTTVGGIHIRTQLPSFERKATVETSFANHSHVIEKVNITGPIIDDKLAYRVSAFYDKDQGLFKDAIDGKGYLNSNRWGVRGQLLYVGDQVTDRLIFNYSRSDEYNNNTSGPFGNSFLTYANGTAPATYESTLRSRLGRSVLTYDPYRPANTGTGTLTSFTRTASNEITWTPNEYTFSSITAYGNFRLLPINGKGNQLLDISNSHTNNWTDQYSQEFRIASPKDQPIEWVGGLYGLYEKIWNYSETIYGHDAARWFNVLNNKFAASTDPGLLEGSDYHVDGKSTTLHFASYGQATYHYDEQLALTFGLRDSWERRIGSNYAWEQYLNPAYSPATIDAAFKAANSGLSMYDTGGISKDRNMLTGIFNPSYKVNDNILVYGLVARGEKSAATNFATPILGSKGQFIQFQPTLTKAETSWDYEVGAKTNWLDGKLVANVNFYYSDIYNFQASVVDSSFTDNTGNVTPKTYLSSIPQVRLQGVETNLRWSPIERLWLNAAGAYTGAFYVNYWNAPPPPDYQFTGGPTSVPRNNTRWEYLPQLAFSVGANYEHPLGAAFAGFGDWANRPVTAFGYVNANWQDRTQFTSPLSVVQYWQPPYTIVNAGFGLRTDDERYTLSFWVKNLLDRREVSNTSATTGTGGWTQGNATTPATYALTQYPRSFGGSLRITLY